MGEIIIVAGPNGAGKTSFANQYISAEREGLAFVNADEIARDLSSLQIRKGKRDLLAGRAMLAKVDALVAGGDEFMLETTLATLIYAQRIPRWKVLGYRVER